MADAGMDNMITVMMIVIMMVMVMLVIMKRAMRMAVMMMRRATMTTKRRAVTCDTFRLHFSKGHVDLIWAVLGLSWDPAPARGP